MRTNWLLPVRAEWFSPMIPSWLRRLDLCEISAFKPIGAFIIGTRIQFFRLTNLHAALGVAQLERIEEIINRKRWIGQEYNRHLGGIKICSYQWKNRGLATSTGVRRCPLRRSRHGHDCFWTEAETAWHRTRPFFWECMNSQFFHRRGLFLEKRYPITERIARQGLYLPSGLALTAEQLDEVCAAVHEALS